jgi:hypothetical protein
MPRPKKLEVPEIGTAEEEVAKMLQRVCDIPGCSSKFHLQEAKQIILILRDFGYIKENNT